MLRRAKRLFSIFDQYCVQHGHPQFKLDRDEWRQIDYLLCITQPFYKWTTGLSKTKDVTIHNVFRVYNKLFDHLETSIRQLQRKKVPWKQTMLRALHAGKEKLSVYYSKTEQVHGDLYATGTILAPQHKLQFFSSKEWGDNDPKWPIKYKKYLQDYMEPYKQQLPEAQLPSKCLSSGRNDGDMELLFNDDAPQNNHQAKANFDDELTQYLERGMYSIPYSLI